MTCLQPGVKRDAGTGKFMSCTTDENGWDKIVEYHM